MQILQDIKTAVKLTGEIRKARKEGAGVEVRKVWRIPVLKSSYWPWTMEACLMRGGETEKAVVAVFDSLPEEVQHSLTFTPEEKPGKWVERARFWQQQLKPALPPEMYHAVMLTYIHWYAHCLRMRSEKAERRAAV